MITVTLSKTETTQSLSFDSVFFYILVVTLILKPDPGSIKKLFKHSFVKHAGSLSDYLFLSLPVIDFTPLSLAIVFLSALRGWILDKVSLRVTST